MSVLSNQIIPPPLVKEGRFNIITLLRFLDETVIGTFNKLMDESNQKDRKIECFPYKADRIEQLTGEIPDDGTAKRYVTYRIRSAEPALLTRGVRDVRYRHRATIQDPTEMNDLGTPIVTDIEGKWVDYTIRLDCFAPTWQESEQLALDVEALLEICTNYITSKGAVKFIYAGRTSDVYHMKTQYFYEPLMWKVRIEKIKVVKGESFQELWSIFDTGLMNIINDKGSQS